MAFGEEGVGEVGADEAGYAGDEVGGHCGVSLSCGDVGVAGWAGVGAE
jgi:hypothetical protein